jgi:catechol 2,3-dioxygenase-like lactoylglutathione lyase family enzyme
MIDHTSISVKNYEISRKFYEQTLSKLGYVPLFVIDEKHVKTVGYGKEGKPFFWISPDGDQDEVIGKAKGVHIAFSAANVEQVNAWYHECLKYGGKDNGLPGPRAEYHPGYYGAFIIDPDGWRIEACYHGYQGK